ncbi:hypothetical protein Tco_0677965 [Tanacetum coccineum]|uniref:Uncharacterized protein n=1 Tax=Tanacetum coccineum TaxID=301880 RepID=A0ABQ4XDP8_9ASTR
MWGPPSVLVVPLYEFHQPLVWKLKVGWDCFLLSLLLAPGFFPWESFFSAGEEVLGALNSIGTSALQMARMWSVKDGPSGIMYSNRRDREDLENLWKLVKTKHGYTRHEEAYERVLWGDLKVMFEPDVEDNIWRNLQGQKILLWKLYDSCGIHFVRFENMHIYMLVEKRYPLSPTTITDMLNRKLQADYWNETCYQLLKLITKQLKNP